MSNEPMNIVINLIINLMCRAQRGRGTSSRYFNLLCYVSFRIVLLPLYPSLFIEAFVLFGSPAANDCERSCNNQLWERSKDLLADREIENYSVNLREHYATKESTFFVWLIQIALASRNWEHKIFHNICLAHRHY